MSKGKYSPSLTREHLDRPYRDFCYNADRAIPVGDEDDTRTGLANYDAEGYDSYGYSAFGEDGEYIDIGMGVDRWGYTEMEYIVMDDDEFEGCGP